MVGKERRRRLSSTEWLLLGMIALGLLMVLFRWDYISTQVSEAVKSYFD